MIMMKCFCEIVDRPLLSLKIFVALFPTEDIVRASHRCNLTTHLEPMNLR